MKRSTTQILAVFVLCARTAPLPARDVFIPAVEGPWWRVAGNPDLGELTGERQQLVDFAVWQAADGTWQLWSCIRHTKIGGHTRLFYRWEGRSLTEPHWSPRGVAMTADPKLGEPLGGLQAPHVVRHRGVFWMVYGDWEHIRLARSEDGKEFRRVEGAGPLFGEGLHANARDPMLLFTRGAWHCYYTAFPAGRGHVYSRTSEDLLRWSDPVVVSYGGVAGTNPSSCECPFVVELHPGDYFLFRTQLYGPGAQTTVYRSSNPHLFGIDDDSCLVVQLNLCAPEILRDEGAWFIAALAPDLDGIRIARLAWKRFARRVFDFDEESERARWKAASGDLASVFARSGRSGPEPKVEHFVSTAGAGSPPPDDTLTGVVEGPEFSTRSAELLVYVSGGDDRERVYAAVVDARTGEEYARVTGKRTDVLVPVVLDARAFLGRPVKVRVVDRSQAPWGRIGFGGILERAPEEDR